MRIKIKEIKHSEQISKKTSKPFTSCRLTVVDKEGKDLVISGFGSSITKTWHAGDTVDVEVAKNDRGYWNFTESVESLPSEDPILKVLKEISAKLEFLVKPVAEDMAKSFGGEVGASGGDETKCAGKLNICEDEIPHFLK